VGSAGTARMWACAGPWSLPSSPLGLIAWIWLTIVVYCHCSAAVKSAYVRPRDIAVLLCANEVLPPLSTLAGVPPSDRLSAQSTPLRYDTRRREAIPRCDALSQGVPSPLSRLLVLQPV
jgi:hypothetical protein